MPHADPTPLDALWPAVASRLRTTGCEPVPVSAARDRVLAADVRAGRDLPAADLVARDGWAVRAADTAGASPGRPVRLLRLSGHAFAGSGEPPAVRPGTAVAAATGGLLPEGADAVVVAEKARVDAGDVLVETAVRPGRYVRLRGSEVVAGETVVARGTRVDPLHLAALAATGVTEVEVARRPLVAVVATGSELVLEGSAAERGQVVATNGPLLARWLTDLLGTPQPAPRLEPDEATTLEGALSDALATSDVVVTTGGTAVGDRDLVREVLRRLGVEPVIDRIAVRPGRTTFVGRRDGAWVVALPGPPAGVVAGWALLVRPLLLALQGAADPGPRRVPVRLAATLERHPSETRLVECRLAAREGRLWAAPVPGRGLPALAGADVLVMVPPGTSPALTGDDLETILLER